MRYAWGMNFDTIHDLAMSVHAARDAVERERLNPAATVGEVRAATDALLRVEKALREEAMDTVLGTVPVAVLADLADTSWLSVSEYAALRAKAAAESESAWRASLDSAIEAENAFGPTQPYADLAAAMRTTAEMRSKLEDAHRERIRWEGVASLVEPMFDALSVHEANAVAILSDEYVMSPDVLKKVAVALRNKEA